MPIGPGVIIGGGLLLLALGKRGGKAPSSVAPQQQPVQPSGGGGTSGQDIAKGIIGAAGSLATTVVGALTHGGVSAAGGGAVTSSAATETALVTATETALTAADVGYGILGGVFILVLVGILYAGPIISMVQSNIVAFRLQKEVRGGRRYFLAILFQQQKTFETIMEKVVPDLNKKGPPYPNLNPSSGVGAGSAVANLGNASPYSFTRGLFDRDAFDAADLNYNGDSWYYVNAVDPRIPWQPLVLMQAIARYAWWVRCEAMNTCIWNFYGTSPDGIILPGTPQAQITGPGGLNPQGRAIFSMEPSAFRSAAEAWFGALPVKFNAGLQIPTSYDQLRGLVAQAITGVAGQTATQDGTPFTSPAFTKFEATMKFFGIAGAVSQAANVGFSQLWPGDLMFALGIWSRLGLGQLGWPPPLQLNIPGTPGYGGGSNGWSWFIFDPTRTWAIDVKSSGAADAPRVYPYPGGAAAAGTVGAGLGRYGGARFAGARFGGRRF